MGEYQQKVTSPITFLSPLEYHNSLGRQKLEYVSKEGMRNISHKISISMNNFDSHVYSDLPFCFSFRIFEQIKNNLSDKQSRGKLILTLLIPSMRENYEIMAFFTEFSDVRSTNSGFGTFSSPPSP